MKDRRKPTAIKWTGKDRRVTKPDSEDTWLDIVVCIALGLAIFAVCHKLLEVCK